MVKDYCIEDRDLTMRLIAEGILPPQEKILSLLEEVRDCGYDMDLNKVVTEICYYVGGGK